MVSEEDLNLAATHHNSEACQQGVCRGPSGDHGSKYLVSPLLCVSGVCLYARNNINFPEEVLHALTHGKNSTCCMAGI